MFTHIEEFGWESFKLRGGGQGFQMQKVREWKPGPLALAAGDSEPERAISNSRSMPEMSSNPAKQNSAGRRVRVGRSKTNSVRESAEDMRRRSSDFYCFSEWSQLLTYADSKSSPEKDARTISAPFYTTLVLAAVLTSQLAGASLRRGWPLLAPTEDCESIIDPVAESPAAVLRRFFLCLRQDESNHVISAYGQGFHSPRKLFNFTAALPHKPLAPLSASEIGTVFEDLAAPL